MKRLLFVTLVCGIMTMPSLGASSLGFWNEGAPGTTHLVWNLEPENVIEIQVPGGQAFDVDTSQEAVFPAGALSSPLAVLVLSGPNLTYNSAQHSFSSTSAFDVHLKMDNFKAPNVFKEVWVDVMGTGTVVPTGVVALDGRATSFTYDLLQGPGPGTGADFGWRIQPNPSFEEVEFSIVPAAGALATLTGIHADTICVPVPGAFLLAGLGAAAVGWLRTRRRL